MSTISDSPKSTVQKAELHSGDRYSREEFHRLYLETPENFKAELIGGIDLDRDEEREADEDGIMKLTSFPGLWIHAASLLSDDYQKMMSVLQEGLASAEHAEFVQKLADARAS